METMQDLIDIEAIKQLRARYSLLLDAQEWSALRTLFADDCAFSVGSGDYASPDAFVENLRVNLSGELHIHIAQMPIIEKTGANTARGMWIFTNQSATGHYQDEYVRTASGWRFSHVTMTWIVPPSEELLRTRKGQFAASAEQWRKLAELWGSATGSH